MPSGPLAPCGLPTARQVTARLTLVCTADVLYVQDDGDIPEEVEAKILDTLLRIRSQDPTIYQKDVQFFKEEDGDELGEQETDGKPGLRATKAAKPLYLKDMIAKQVCSGAEMMTRIVLLYS